MRKLSKALPLVLPADPPDADVVVPSLLLLLPPHAAAMSETPTAKDAAMLSHFQECLRFKLVPPKAGFIGAREDDIVPGATVHSY
jgi:hypothetical protein